MTFFPKVEPLREVKPQCVSQKLFHLESSKSLKISTVKLEGYSVGLSQQEIKK
jgi:hypothetical protein